MNSRTFYLGTKFAIAFVIDPNGECPARDFFAALSLQDQARVHSLFRIAADHGQFHNPEKFGNLGKGLYEFKSFQIRMPFKYSDCQRHVILVTHGFIKKKDKAPREEIDRAWRLLEQDQSAKLILIQKPKNSK